MEQARQAFGDDREEYVVDVHWDVVRPYRVMASSREEAERIVREKVESGDVCVWTDGFEATGDVEVKAAGRTGPDGVPVYG